MLARQYKHSEYIYSITQANIDKLGITISEELTGLILI